MVDIDTTFEDKQVTPTKNMDKKTSVTANEYELAKGVFQRMPDTSLWRRLDKDDFVITRFDEGYNSNIMKCELTKEARERFDAKPRFAGQPRAVVLKMIPPKNFIDNDPLEQALINVVAAEQGLAPKVLLATANSFIIEFVEVSACLSSDDNNLNVVISSRVSPTKKTRSIQRCPSCSPSPWHASTRCAFLCRESRTTISCNSFCPIKRQSCWKPSERIN